MTFTPAYLTSVVLFVLAAAHVMHGLNADLYILLGYAGLLGTFIARGHAQTVSGGVD